MDLSDPTRAVTPTLDGPVLAVLAAAGRPLTVGEVAAAAGRGSEIGVRRCLARLVEQGLVTAKVMGRNQVHELNRAHVAAPIAEALAGLRAVLWRRLREEIAGWRPPPVVAYAFGSAARGDGGVDSDVDVLLVHPLFAEERRGRPSVRALAARLGDAAVVVDDAGAEAAESWQAQLDRLRARVRAWSGNHLQVLDLSVYQYAEMVDGKSALLVEVARDGVELANRLPPAARRRGA